MPTRTFTLTLHMVSSLDGMIAKKDNSVAWFDTPDYYEKGVTAPGGEEFLNSVDCYVMGARTYEHALTLSKNYGWPYGDVPTVVVSHRQLPIERPNVECYSGDLRQLVEERLKPRYQNVWIVGGALLAREFLRMNLADEIRLSVLPIILGDGLLFLESLSKELPLHLKNVTAYKTGMVELHYEIKKSERS
ncbi:MAG: dihydrofolate reductase [Bacteroidetes bacterium]|nr:dihydrofolate reductase [Bacteroidota bacterium]